MPQFYKDKGSARIQIPGFGVRDSIMRRLARLTVTSYSPINYVEAFTTRTQSWLDGVDYDKAKASIQGELSVLTRAAEDLYFLQGEDIGVFTSGVFQTLETDFLGDGLIEMIYSIPSHHRGSASFILSPDVHRSIRGLKDSDGRFLMDPPDSRDQPPRLMGFPCYEEEAAAAGHVAFGSWASAYEVVGPDETHIIRNRKSAAPLIEYRTQRHVEAGPADHTAAVLLKI